MSTEKTSIVFVGSGAIATALGDILTENPKHDVVLLSIEDEVVKAINEQHINLNYFPNHTLNSSLKATSDLNVLNKADIIFMAVPSTVVVDYLITKKNHIKSDALIVNLAKGFGNETQIIPQCVETIMDNPFATMKGPSFAREIVNRQATGFTIASKDKSTFNIFKKLFINTPIHLDFTDDVTGVEYASILKNIYAIIIGIVDANFDSPNLRSLILSKAINEIRSLIITFGGQEKTIFNYCGFGDFSLTALNDLSRNRTLGLLIGKGFFSKDISERVVLEGRIAANIFYEQLLRMNICTKNYPLMEELYKVFNENYDIKKFVNRILKD